MELAIPFKLRNDEYNDIAAEFNINYDKKRNDKKQMPGFVELFPDKRINLNTQDFDLELFKEIKELHPDFAIRLTSKEQMAWILELQKNDIAFFFDANLLPASSLTILNYLIDEGVSDIYISDDLFYSFKEVANIIHSHDIKLRFILNKVAATLPIDEEKAAWIPPDAIPVLQDDIDIYEFDCGDPYDWHKFDVYYNTWIIKQDWRGNLQEVIPNLTIFIPESSLMGYDWIKYKTQCNFHCLNKTSKCNKCSKYIQLARDLDNRQWALNKDNLEHGQEQEKSD